MLTLPCQQYSVTSLKDPISNMELSQSASVSLVVFYRYPIIPYSKFYTINCLNNVATLSDHLTAEEIEYSDKCKNHVPEKNLQYL